MDTTTTNKRPPAAAHAFMVPNTPEGRAWIEQARTYANYAELQRIRVRGRGARAGIARVKGLNPRAYDQDLPTAFAARLAVYIGSATRDKSANNTRAWFYSEQNMQRIRAEEFQESARIWRDLAERRDERIAQLARTLEDCAQDRHNEQTKRYAAERELARIPAWIRRIVAWWHAEK